MVQAYLWGVGEGIREMRVGCFPQKRTRIGGFGPTGLRGEYADSAHLNGYMGPLR